MAALGRSRHHTLTVSTCHGLAMRNDQTFLIRDRSSNDIDVSACLKIYQTLDLSEVDLSFAGRLKSNYSSLTALERLSSGDPLHLKQSGDRWVVTDKNGVIVCRLAKKYAPPNGADFVAGSVFAIITRFRDDSSEEFQAQPARDEWSVVLPELIFQT